MKKIYFLLAACLLNTTLSTAQEFYSFEAEEGYLLGDINNQQGWITTSLGGSDYTAMQVVTEAQAKVGSRSLKIAYDPLATFQPIPIMGAFKSLLTPLDKANFSMSYSIQMTNAPGTNSSIFALSCGSVAEQKLVMEVYFSYDGKILVLENADTEFTVTQIGTWQEGVWYDVAISGGATSVTYSLNGVEKHEGTLLYNMDELRFAHDNYSGSAYIDNVNIAHTALGTASYDLAKEWNISPNPVESILNLADLQNVENLTITDLTGKKLFESNNSLEQIQVDFLSKGIYILTVKTTEAVISRKFIKN